MRITIDGLEIAHQFDGGITLWSVVEEVSKGIYQNHRVITGYEINGSVFEGEDSELDKIPVSDTHNLNILTNSLKSIIIESLNGVNEYLPQLVNGIEECAVLIQADKRTEAMDLLQQCVTGLGWFTEIIDKSSQLTASTLSPSALEDLPVVEKRQAINRALNPIVENLTSGDYLAVSDLLEYELVPVLNDWIVLIPQLAERIDKGLN